MKERGVLQVLNTRYVPIWLPCQSLSRPLLPGYPNTQSLATGACRVRSDYAERDEQPESEQEPIADLNDAPIDLTEEDDLDTAEIETAEESGE